VRDTTHASKQHATLIVIQTSITYQHINHHTLDSNMNQLSLSIIAHTDTGTCWRRTENILASESWAAISFALRARLAIGLGTPHAAGSTKSLNDIVLMDGLVINAVDAAGEWRRTGARGNKEQANREKSR